MTSASQHRSAAEPRPAKKAPLQVYLPCLFILVTSKLQFFSNWGLTYICRFADFVPNLIRMGMNKAERFENLRRIAQYQMQVLMEAERIKELPEGGDLPK